MGRRKKKKKRSSVHQQNSAAPSAVAESSAPKAAQQGRDEGTKDGAALEQDVLADSKTAKTAEESSREPSESQRLEAALRERSPFTGKFEPYDAEAHGLKWEEMPLSEELPDLLGRMRAGKGRDDERNQPKVQVDPDLARGSGFAQEQGADKGDEGGRDLDLEYKPRSRAGLYATGIVILGALAVGVFLWPGLRTRGVGADVGGEGNAQTETLPSSVRVQTDSDEEAADDVARQSVPVVVAKQVEDGDPQPAVSDDPRISTSDSEREGSGALGEPDAVEEEEDAEHPAKVKAEKDAEGDGVSQEERDVPAEAPVAEKSTVRRAQADVVPTDKKRAVEGKQGGQVEKKAEVPPNRGDSEQAQGTGDAADVTDWKTGLKRTTGWKNKVDFLRQYISAHPGDDAAMARLATMLMEMSFARKEADSLARRAAKINPDNAAAWLVIGYVHQLSGDRKAAEKAYRTCAQCSGPPYYVTECRRLL